MVKDVAEQPDQPASGDAVIVEPAGFIRRLAAAGIDGIPVFTLWALGLLGWSMIDGAHVPERRWNALDQIIDISVSSPDLVILAGVLFVLILILWHALGERLMGASLGKRILGLQVIDGRGESPGLGRSLMVGVMRLVSGATLGAGFLWALVDPEGRTVHDRATGTFVIRDEQAREIHS